MYCLWQCSICVGNKNDRIEEKNKSFPLFKENNDFHQTYACSVLNMYFCNIFWRDPLKSPFLFFLINPGEYSRVCKKDGELFSLDLKYLHRCQCKEDENSLWSEQPDKDPFHKGPPKNCQLRFLKRLARLQSILNITICYRIYL